ncbi:alpha-tocopherol transfer protein-like [Agrilus planipennis]|uniref:Alpha-tocopherol transfer protein-like n=1 Tax=Agrilus planipennis TaxID=224129 RepID=A0A7F5R4Y6_AGRPL|nr:alpha-tocopherol transfer protein-like [Agrilus planipennis]XP_025831032.1 alpha-tocopherol transfer protein-like [Agrilus planipennis]XP_025831033.1 alpha-tocopherol transfer protein-like [Agrilus planipennis]XP_025831034.1 alpha-tocopherol transfer protein-like [Agrilus planipennis]
MTLIQPSPDMQVMIRKELNENVETRQKDLEHMKDWLKKQPHLPDTWDEERIMTFLRGCKFSLEKCKRKLDMYFTMRAAVPEIFTNRDVTRPELQEILKFINIPPLPGLTPNGRRVVCMRGVDKTVMHPKPEDAMKLVFMIGDIRLAAEEVGVAGDVYILDASVVTSGHFARVTPALVKKFLVIVQEAYPVKLKEVHVVNVHPLVDVIYNWVKPFLKEKIKNRVYIHENFDSLYKYVPKDMLPEEYGGSAGKMQDYHEQWIKKMEEYGPWFKEQEEYKTDESKRPGKPKSYDDIFGLDGSFRQLKID